MNADKSIQSYINEFGLTWCQTVLAAAAKQRLARSAKSNVAKLRRLANSKIKQLGPEALQQLREKLNNIK